MHKTFPKYLKVRLSRLENVQSEIFFIFYFLRELCDT